jgi:Down syndrome cell adhesion protein
MKCIATGSPLPQVTWTLDGFQIPEDGRFRVGDYVTTGGLLVSYVNITHVRPEDGGRYECLAGNELASVHFAGRLQVHGPPVVRSMPNRTAVNGEPLLLNCPVGGHPIQAIYWEKGNHPTPFDHSSFRAANGRKVVDSLKTS